jgi:penicillin-binding protein 1A
VEECASIAAITNSPSYYNPIRHPENNQKRRNIILSEMAKQGKIGDAAYTKAINAPISLRVTAKASESVHSWYTDMVLEDVIEDLSRQYGISRKAAYRMVLSGGLRIEIAMDEKIQRIVEQYYESLRTPRNQDGEYAQSALIVLDASTGDILGVAGARGKKSGNRLQSFATQTLRSPGSTIKPVSVYAPALEEGLIHWGSVYDDVPVEFSGVNGTAPWPRNANGIYRGLTDVSYAVTHSTNTVAVRVLGELGLERSFDFARSKCHLLHLRRDGGANDCDVAALALGQLNYGVTLREMTAAYSIFADGGVYHPYRSYYRVLAEDGRVLLSCPDAAEPVLSNGNAAVMTKLMQEVVKYGTTTNMTLQRLTECAGKTGTTNRDCDRWFIGYTPELICGVWCGFEYPAPMAGSNPCPAIFNNVMEQITKSHGGKTVFEIPSSVLRLTYCADSGKLMTDACLADPRGNRAREGWFVKGNEPTEFCDCHVLCAVSDEDGSVCANPVPMEGQHLVGLLRIHRELPIPIKVSDEKYILTLPPRNDENEE